jgi:hypothetical protein
VAKPVPQVAAPPTPPAPETPVRLVVGTTVHCYETSRDGLDRPAPGIITEVLAGGLVGCMTFHSRAGRHAPCHAIEAVHVALTDDELVAAAAAGKKWVCKPYNPANPQVYKKPAPPAESKPK